MPDRLRSLRFKLTATFILIFGVLQAALWGTVEALRTSYIRNAFDQRLVEQAETAIDVIDADLAKGHTLEESEHLQQIFRPLDNPEYFVQVRTSEGGVAYRSPNLAKTELPFTPLIDKSYELIPYLQTLESDAARQLIKDDALRMVTFLHRPPAGAAYYVSVGASLAPIDRIGTEVRQLLLVFVFVSLVVAGFTTWYIARRSLEPVNIVARRAKQLSAAHLAERLPVPQQQDEVSEMVVVLNEMLDRLEGAFRNQQRFIGDASHELKTPLAVLLAEAQAFGRQPVTADACRDFAQIVESEVRKLLRIVDTFLILSRAQPGHRPTVVADVSLDDAVLEAIHRCRVEASQQRVAVVPKLGSDDSSPEPVVAGDFELICSMIESLIFNAVQNSPPGSNVEVSVRSDHAAANLSVRDKGPSIPEHEWKQLFRVFYQPQPAPTTPGRSGIGLSLVKAVAELHGGSVSIRNIPQGGCEITVRLPTLPTSASVAP